MLDDLNELFSAAGLARRWVDLPLGHQELKANLGELAIQAAHADGLTPSLLELDLRPKQPTIARDDAAQLGRWQQQMRTLRPHLPDDSFPFNALWHGASFVTTQPGSLTELEAVATRLCAAARALPGCGQSVVTACLADDGCAYRRAWGIPFGQRLGHDADAKQGFVKHEPVLVYSARFRGEEDMFASTVGLLEHDLPAARQRDSAAAQTLVAFTPAGEGWGRCKNRHTVLTDVRYAVRSFAAEQGAVAIELVPQEPQFALLFSLLPVEAAAKVRSLTDGLTARRYEVFEADVVWVTVVEPGEVEFVSVCEPVAPDSDGAVELELLTRQIAEVAADRNGN